jgi:SAM-dependent methyltransferase
MTPKNSLIEDILQGCHGNHDWYRSYMSGNWPRIHADFTFICQTIPKSSRILDIGAVPPLLAALLVEHGYSDITVADPNASAFAPYFKKRGIQYLDLDLLNQCDPSLTQGFNLVCFNEVIEHLSGNLLSAVGRVSDCVAPNGHLLVTTPNIRSLSGFVAIFLLGSGLASKPYETVRAQYERSTAKYGYYGHLREFTPREVITLIESFGFKNIAVRYQPSYLQLSRFTKLIALLEWLLPYHRLFGKYLFQRPKN